MKTTLETKIKTKMHRPKSILARSWNHKNVVSPYFMIFGQAQINPTRETLGGLVNKKQYTLKFKYFKTQLPSVVGLSYIYDRFLSRFFWSIVISSYHFLRLKIFFCTKNWWYRDFAGVAFSFAMDVARGGGLLILVALQREIRWMLSRI